MAERIFLHIGTPKSGTSYLQSVLWSNLPALQAQGLLLPGTFQLHYTAAKGVTGRRGMQHRTQSRDAVAWDRLTGEVNRWQRDALISHELFAPASAEQAVAARAELVGAELHLVLTMRALHRQLPAGWQQQVKGGHSVSYRDYLEQVRTGADPHGSWFWSVQDVPAIVRRWGPDLPPERVHLVTCPTTSADPTLLWQRFATVLGVQGGSYQLDIPRKNVSLGAIEAELLRRVQAARDYRFRDGNRHLWTRRLLAGGLLAKREGGGISTPDGVRSWIEQRTRLMTADVVAAGYDVVGDLEDLRWAPSGAGTRLVSDVTEPEIEEVSAWTIGRLQEELVDRQPDAPYPNVGPEDGVPGILELLEHIRAADTDARPRPPEHAGTGRTALRSLVHRLRH